MKFEEIEGDLFGCPNTVSLAHCISEDCRMGKGIAILFRDKFGGIDSLKEQVAKGAKTGSVAILKRGNRDVFYLITKKSAYDKPTLETLRSSLEAMKSHVIARNVANLAMPRIGCGLDGLNWAAVSRMIQEIFAETNVNITIYTKK